MFLYVVQLLLLLECPLDFSALSSRNRAGKGVYLSLSLQLQPPKTLSLCPCLQICLSVAGGTTNLPPKPSGRSPPEGSDRSGVLPWYSILPLSSCLSRCMRSFVCATIRATIQCVFMGKNKVSFFPVSFHSY